MNSLFVISNAGEVLIEKHWRKVTPRAVCDYFWDEVCKFDRPEDISPIIETSNHILINIYRENLFLLAVSTQEMPPLLAIEFLHRVVDVMTAYFDILDEISIKDNFSTVYQLLEEMMDNGFPLTTEPNTLMAMIKPPSVMGRLTAAATGQSGISEELPASTISNIPWRETGIRYAQNEIYLDVIEEVDAIIDRSGAMVTCEVSGTIMATCRLSGMPDMSLTFLDPELIDDCSFHPCVRYNRYERDKAVSFVPPDGIFELMKYCVHPPEHFVPPLYCQPQTSFDYSNSQGQILVMVGMRPNSSVQVAGNRAVTAVEDVCVIVTFTRSVRTVNLTCTAGTCSYDESQKLGKWNVGKLTKDKGGQLSGIIYLHPDSLPEEAPPVLVEWKVPTASISGLCVSTLILTNESYRPYKGVRALTQSGKYQIRS